MFVNARGDVLEVTTLEQGRDAAGHLDVLDGAPQFAGRLGIGLAALVGDGAGQRVEIVFQQSFQLEQRLNPLPGGGAPPAEECFGRGLDGAIHLGQGRERHFGQDCGRGRVEHLQNLAGVRGLPPPVQ